MTKLTIGNAYKDGEGRRGWFIGPFMSKESIAFSDKVEVKWVEHKRGELRPDWVRDEKRSSLCILLAGRYAMHFSDCTVILEEQGDYVLWGEGSDHRWEAIEDSLIMTVRWALNQDTLATG